MLAVQSLTSVSAASVPVLAPLIAPRGVAAADVGLFTMVLYASRDGLGADRRHAGGAPAARCRVCQVAILFCAAALALATTGHVAGLLACAFVLAAAWGSDTCQLARAGSRDAAAPLEPGVLDQTDRRAAGRRDRRCHLAGRSPCCSTGAVPVRHGAAVLRRCHPATRSGARAPTTTASSSAMAPACTASRHHRPDLARPRACAWWRSPLRSSRPARSAFRHFMSPTWSRAVGLSLTIAGLALAVAQIGGVAVRIVWGAVADYSCRPLLVPRRTGRGRRRGNGAGEPARTGRPDPGDPCAQPGARRLDHRVGGRGLRRGRPPCAAPGALPRRAAASPR